MWRRIVARQEGIPQGKPKAEALGYQPRFLRYVERTKAEALGYLAVVPQEIIVIEPCSADGCFLFETGVWAVPVVLVVEG
jgi:hypothetical protein